eukprot:TRINITY_DN14061_c0_g1_i1.p1 TRINITY_DN14061_c0_g1~~TRINITY_DN14061_c0_g1_i1.p1  ORF type:complete len:119 (-),score=19.77 TRINITY_DN14061_c0_g1_i1:187-543(-)
MDSSTQDICKDLQDFMGGPQTVAERTGSKCFERFTIHQIAKIIKLHPEKYSQTERISLVSSFIASLFISGAYAPIDYADGSGMNVMDIITKKWACFVSRDLFFWTADTFPNQVLYFLE